MKITLGLKVRGFILAAAFFAGLGFGTSASAQLRPYLIDLNSKTVTEIGALGSYTWASGINDAEQVVGYSYTAAGAWHGFITGPNGVGMTDLGTLGGRDSQALGINAAGRVVGYSSTATGALHAFITGPNGVGMTDLGTLGGDSSVASGINDAGQVAGYSSTAAGAYHAFITGPNGVGMTDLGTLGGGDSFARGINDAGQVVGFTIMAAVGYHAFIIDPNGAGMTDLNALVSVPGGAVLTDATGINNHGQVAAISAIIPEPETYAMLLAGLGLLGFVARRHKTA